MENKMEVTYDNQPNWTPLETFSQKYLNQINCNDFMHMGKVGEIELYKNIVTRSYINIDTDGCCWSYSGDGYIQITEESAIRRVE
jgi:hypothetical protein